MSLDTFRTRTTIAAGADSVAIYSLPALQRAFPQVASLPFSLKILLENLLRREDNAFVKADDIRALASWDPRAGVQKEISFMPSRVLLQDFTGVPCVVDLAAMRDGVVVARRHPRAGQPAAAGGARHRSLGAGRSLRHGQRAAAERRARISAQSRTLRLPALGTDRVPQLPRRPARDRHRPSGQHRIPRARRHARYVERRERRVPRHRLRHRLAHDDGEWVWAWWDGVSAESRRRPRCSGSPARC